jgi:hypothetical protein
MGCDIHLYVEKRANQSHDWESADKWTKDRDDSVMRVDQEFYDGRNYRLFSILANVRNGHGFAGVKTGDGFVPISEPRGLPSDVSPNVAALSESWGEDGHSHSYLTVAEIMAFDWTQVSNLCGVLTGEEFEDWTRWGRARGHAPKGWSGGVTGPQVRNITEEEMTEIVERARKHCVENKLYCEAFTAYIRKATENLYVSCEWTQPYYACVGDFISHVLPRLWRLGSPENVRIVFWFDN